MGTFLKAGNTNEASTSARVAMANRLLMPGSKYHGNEGEEHEPWASSARLMDQDSSLLKTCTACPLIGLLLGHLSTETARFKTSIPLSNIRCKFVCEIRQCTAILLALEQP